MQDYQVTDFGRIKQSAVVANSRAEISATAPQGAVWLIDRESVRASAGSGLTMLVYVGTESNENLVDGSGSGELDFADNNSPIIVQSGETIRFVWPSATNGVVVTVNAQYRVARYTDTTRGYSVRGPLEPESVIPHRRKKTTAGYGGGW